MEILAQYGNVANSDKGIWETQIDMRFVITGFGDKYLEEFDYGMLNKIVTIPDWIAEKNEIPRVKEALLLWRTEKAFQFLMKGKIVWIPRSLCTLSNPPAKNIEEWTERHGSD